jgi:hypothetical protein|tara:strand:+ start:105 stop:1358 length:1254 start_codon:yes stop_codon:yes gene_type:complete
LKEYDYTETLLEDIFEVKTSPLLPIYIIDFKVAAHFINGFYDVIAEIAQDDEKLLRNLIKAMWAYRLNRGPDMLDPFDFVAIVADDYKGPVGDDASVNGKGYWRHIEAHKLKMQEYKAGRAPKQDNFILVQDIGYEYIDSKKSSFHYFSKEFFEADDIAGKIARMRRNASKRSNLGKRQILLGTLDGDWQGIVSRADEIFWCNTGPWLPRMRVDEEVVDYYLRKEGLKIKEAKECYTVKVEVGDIGDGLLPGSPLRFFDLYDEDDTWRFSEEDTSYLSKVLKSNNRSNRPDHLESAKKFLLSYGMYLPELSKTSEHDKQLFFKKARRIRKEKANPELKGRNKKLCLEAPKIDFEKCKDLVIRDEDTKQKIKYEEQNLKDCKEDKLCKKAVRQAINAYKTIREDIKEKLKEFIVHDPV